MLQWEWLGGLAPIRRIAVIGAGAWGTALATLLARAGFEVELGCRTKEQVEAIVQTRVNDRYLPGVQLPDQLRVLRAAELNLEGHDLVCLAVPATALPAVLAAHGGQITRRLGMLVAGSGLVAPFGTLPAAFAAARCNARAVAVLGGPARSEGVLAHGGSVVLASRDRGFNRQLRDMLRAAQLDVTVSSDMTGVQLAGVGDRGGSTRRRGRARRRPRHRRRRRRQGVRGGRRARGVRGGQPETFVGLAGAGDLVANVPRRGLGPAGRPRRLTPLACWPSCRVRHGPPHRRWIRWPRSCRDGSSRRNGRTQSASRVAGALGRRGPLEQGM